MNYISFILNNLENQYNRSPNYIWQYLNKNELIVVNHAASRYIVEFESYNYLNNKILTNFIYSTNSGNLTLKPSYDLPKNVEGYPTNKELETLSYNIDYISYITNRS